MNNSTEKSLRYVIIAPPRSGSTWLCDLLEKNGIIKEAEEQYESLHFKNTLKEEDYKRSFEEITEEAFKNSEFQYQDTKIQAFKCLSSQFRNIRGNILRAGSEKKLRTEDMFDLICGEKTKIIVLDRKNTEEMASSWINAIGTEQWVYKKNDRELHTMDNIIVFHKFYRMFHDYIYSDHMHIKKLVNTKNNFLQLYYEDIQEDPKAAIKEIFEYLELNLPKEIIVDSDYRKQRTTDSKKAYERYKRFKPKFILDFLLSLFESIFGDKFKIRGGKGRSNDFYKNI